MRLSGGQFRTGPHPERNQCPRSYCKILVNFVNNCGAIAYNPNTSQYWGGSGYTQTVAEENAISHAGGGNWITYVCTTR